MSFNKKLLWLAISLIAVLAVAGCDSTGAAPGGDIDPTSDTTAPTVTAHSPVSSASGVAMNSNVTATLSEAMDAATIIAANFTLTQGTTAVSGTVSYADSRARFVPAADLTANTEYTATMTTGMTDSAGNHLAETQTWTFTTGGSVDTTAPTVTATTPADAATAVAINSSVTATFSEAMDATTIVAANFTLAAGASATSGTVTYDVGRMAAVFAPSANLAASTTYTATVTTAVEDSTGIALATNRVWTFTTAAAGLGPEPVRLGTAGNFAVLAKTQVSTVPASAITGNVGLSPAAQSYITGFSQTDATGYSTSPQVTGFIYASDMAPPTPSSMTTAISDMETAYTDAAGRTATAEQTNLYSGEIGGATLTPALYKWTGNVTALSSLTISGAANDVWIFQIAGDLTAASAINVTLSGGAQARNIFWQVGGAVTMGTNTHFEGILLGATGITFGTGSSLNGRALAQSAVALDQTTVVAPVQ